MAYGKTWWQKRLNQGGASEEYGRLNSCEDVSGHCLQLFYLPVAGSNSTTAIPRFAIACEGLEARLAERIVKNNFFAFRYVLYGNKCDRVAKSCVWFARVIDRCGFFEIFMRWRDEEVVVDIQRNIFCIEVDMAGVFFHIRFWNNDTAHNTDDLTFSDGFFCKNGAFIYWRFPNVCFRRQPSM